ncbi:hypothetical protein HDU77_001095 [Chytriomyces hyalinus]|nr:hypothetical protein HDU77_001095 [Chytriomyces hyalinus]
MVMGAALISASDELLGAKLIGSVSRMSGSVVSDGPPTGIDGRDSTGEDAGTVTESETGISTKVAVNALDDYNAPSTSANVATANMKDIFHIGSGHIG